MIWLMASGDADFGQVYEEIDVYSTRVSRYSIFLGDWNVASIGARGMPEWERRGAVYSRATRCILLTSINARRLCAEKRRLQETLSPIR